MIMRRSSRPKARTPRSPRRRFHEELLLGFEILENLPLGVIVLQLDNPGDIRSLRIVELNRAAAAVAGVKRDDCRGRPLAEFPQLLRPSFLGRCLDALKARATKRLGVMSHPDGHGRPVAYRVQATPLSGEFMTLAFEKVTEHTLIAHLPGESVEWLSLLIKGLRKYAIFQLDPQGHVRSWNAGAERMKGYRAQEIIGKHFSVFYPNDVAGRGRPDRLLAEAAQHGESTDEGWRVRKDGSRFWASVVVTRLVDSNGRLCGFAKVTRDMTDRRRKEKALTVAKERLEIRVARRAAVLARVNQELQTEILERERAQEQLKVSLEELRALTARIQRVREEERIAIAREIHDELGQACTAIKMDLALIGRKATSRQTRIKAKVASAIQLVDDTITNLRRIASELRPGTLDDLGLAAALEWQAQEFARRTGIECRVGLPEDAIVVDADRSTGIFRIFQESLTNVARHAHATSVAARLAVEAGQIVLEVRDNGRGFTPEEVDARKSLGLLGMQ